MLHPICFLFTLYTDTDMSIFGFPFRTMVPYSLNQDYIFHFYLHGTSPKKTTFPPEFCNENCTICVCPIQKHDSGFLFFFFFFYVVPF